MSHLVKWDDKDGRRMGTYPCATMRGAVTVFNTLGKSDGSVHQVYSLRIEREGNGGTEVVLERS